MESSVVQVLESSLVSPKEATPREGLWLSPIDHAMANVGHTPVVYLYRSCFDVARLKEAMAKALVVFYPLAGRLGRDGDGRVEISCNGEGALFVVARSCLRAEDVDFSKPSPKLKSMFVPTIDQPATAAPPILAAQVTYLKCGGAALGVAIHHAAADCMSVSHFMRTWSSLYRNNGDSAAAAAAAGMELPCHDRTLLRARSPPAVHPDTLSVLYPKVTLVKPSGPNTTEVFPISRDQLVTLRRLCGGATSFVSLSALVWQCMSIVRRLPPNAIARLSFPANARHKTTPPLPAGYFGNGLISLCATGEVREIASEALASVAARISGAIARMGDEVVRSAIDYLELAAKQDDSQPRKHEHNDGDLPKTEVRIVSWLNLQLYDADFGSGGPQVMTRADTNSRGFVHLIDSGPANPGAVNVVVRMEAANVKEFEQLLYANLPKQA